MRDIPRLALDEALVKATGLPSDGQAWTDDKTRIYCQAVDMLRAHLPIWSITGYSQMVNDKERLAMMRRAAGVVR